MVLGNSANDISNHNTLRKCLDFSSSHGNFRMFVLLSQCLNSQFQAISMSHWNMAYAKKTISIFSHVIQFSFEEIIIVHVLFTHKSASIFILNSLNPKCYINVQCIKYSLFFGHVLSLNHQQMEFKVTFVEMKKKICLSSLEMWWILPRNKFKNCKMGKKRRNLLMFDMFLELYFDM